MGLNTSFQFYFVMTFLNSTLKFSVWVLNRCRRSFQQTCAKFYFLVDTTARGLLHQQWKRSKTFIAQEKPRIFQQFIEAVLNMMKQLLITFVLNRPSATHPSQIFLQPCSNNSIQSLYGGQFTLSTQLIKPNYQDQKRLFRP